MQTLGRESSHRWMLDFGWHLRGSVPLNGLDGGISALDSVERMLQAQRKAVSERGSDYLVFNDPLWASAFQPNWKAMVIYDRGRFWIEQSVHGQRLRYDLRSLHGMVFCLIGAMVFFFSGFTDGGLLGGIKHAAAIFAWVYGMNLVLAHLRVPTVIRDAVTGD